MKLYTKVVDGARKIYGTFNESVSDSDKEVSPAFDDAKKYCDNGKGGIKDADGNEVKVYLDGKCVIPYTLEEKSTNSDDKSNTDTKEENPSTDDSTNIEIKEDTSDETADSEDTDNGEELSNISSEDTQSTSSVKKSKKKTTTEDETEVG